MTRCTPGCAQKGSFHGSSM
ncbi:gallidermin family protein [Deinococcus wulumuqiensis]|uniref:Gallidermin family protein n=1 Tax=Deinococcus wulumuqiensis TaxID=980427 RepID=A0A345IJZ8_9DEIO|nr:gallidermin family protein [Deinococcus wulumuqiensis]